MHHSSFFFAAIFLVVIAVSAASGVSEFPSNVIQPRFEESKGFPAVVKMFTVGEPCHSTQAVFGSFIKDKAGSTVNVHYAYEAEHYQSADPSTRDSTQRQWGVDINAWKQDFLSNGAAQAQAVLAGAAKPADNWGLALDAKDKAYIEALKTFFGDATHKVARAAAANKALTDCLAWIGLNAGASNAQTQLASLQLTGDKNHCALACLFAQAGGFTGTARRIRSCTIASVKTSAIHTNFIAVSGNDDAMTRAGQKPVWLDEKIATWNTDPWTTDVYTVENEKFWRKSALGSDAIPAGETAPADVGHKGACSEDRLIAEIVRADTAASTK